MLSQPAYIVIVHGRFYALFAGTEIIYVPKSDAIRRFPGIIIPRHSVYAWHAADACYTDDIQ